MYLIINYYIDIHILKAIRKEETSSNSVDDNNNCKLTNADQAIIVSDIHIGYEKSNVKSFTKFLDNLMTSDKIKNYSLFVLGDLFDLWRRRDSIFYPESDRILSLINQFRDVYYIPGNHDYTILDATQHFLTLTVIK